MADLRVTVAELNRHTWTLGAISIAAERGVLLAIAEGPRSVHDLAAIAGLAPPTANALCDVLAALGLVAIEEGLVRDAGALAAARDPAAAKVLAADLRSTLGTVRDATYAAEAGAAIEGWRAVDPVAVRAQALVSHAVSLGLRDVLTKVPDLHARLSADGACLLDVGAGAAGLGIAFCQIYPGLRVVGLEPSETACVEARRAVDAAGLADRIEIRRMFGQELDDDSAYAAAYVAQMFVPDAALDAVLRATCRALVPGGWLQTGAVALDGSDLPSSISRFRNAIWGGGVRRADRVIAAIEAAGFTSVRAMPSPPGAMVPILARRPVLDGDADLHAPQR